MKFLSLKQYGISILWLIHISAFIGINIGYADFFLPLSAYNLWYICILLFWFYPILSWRKIILFFVIAILGFTFEAVGVATGKIFGEYTYGKNLGLKIAEVPIIIGINWAVLSFVCSEIARRIKIKSIILKAILASLLMVVFDFFIEQTAPQFNFWFFELSPVPLQNYISWFILAFVFNWSVLKITKKGNTVICYHIYAVQVLFFMLFYVFK